MAVAVESFILKSVQAHCISSALTNIVSGSSIPESAADLASLIAGKFKAHMANLRGEARADLRGVAKAHIVVVVVAEHNKVVAKGEVPLDHRQVRVISPHFFSN